MQDDRVDAALGELADQVVEAGTGNDRPGGHGVVERHHEEPAAVPPEAAVPQGTCEGPVPGHPGLPSVYIGRWIAVNSTLGQPGQAGHYSCW
ncbi:hypothetical protein Prum_002180 [Phytohabitans rumicis]|uniref:Uncharacterized protein n=1 Tax=Phytohabitans rumicis TaxID=1076125 RepID=A0A6V8KXL7_9ACTN|nr:hypothetical protein Prum_002180 [Phytohabitans rumicis]